MLTTIQLIYKNREIKNKKIILRLDSNPQTLGFEATEHMRNRMRKENCRKRIYVCQPYDISISITCIYSTRVKYICGPEKEIFYLNVHVKTSRDEWNLTPLSLKDNVFMKLIPESLHTLKLARESLYNVSWTCFVKVCIKCHLLEYLIYLNST